MGVRFQWPQWGTHLTPPARGGTAAVVVMPGGLRLPGALLYLQIVEDEEEGLSGQALVELHGVRVWGWHLVVVGGRWAGVPGEVLPVGIESISACPCRLKGGQKATPCLPTASLPPYRSWVNVSF